MNIHELTAEDKGLIKETAILHRKAFPDFFLTQLGLPFLRTLYKGYLDDKDSGIIIMEHDGSLKGFIAYSNDYPRFYKGLIKHKILRFAWCSFLATIRHPSFARRLFGAFRKSESVAKTEKYVEIASICTDPDAQGQGIGSALIAYLIARVDFNDYAYINLETDADGNEGANRFYQKNGFALARQYTTPEGRKMNEYHYSPEGINENPVS